MGRMIDADALIAQMEADAEQMEDQIAKMFTYAAINDVKRAPTIEERKTGRWIWQWDKFDIDTANEAVCSKCKKISAMPVGYFCKWCGADMRGEEHDEMGG